MKHRDSANPLLRAGANPKDRDVRVKTALESASGEERLLLKLMAGSA